MKKYRIGILAYGESLMRYQSLLGHYSDDELEIYLFDCPFGSINRRVSDAEALGVEVYVAGGANYPIMRSSFGFPTVQISPGFYDYYCYFKEAKKNGPAVALLSFEEPTSIDIKQFEEMFDITITEHVFNNTENLSELVKNCTCQTVVGSSLACKLASEKGIPFQLAYPGEQKMLSVIKQAKLLAQDIRNERNKSSFYSTIIDNSLSGIIGISSDGTVISYNRSAELMLGISSVNARGKSIYELLPELRMDEVNSDEFLIARSSDIELRGKRLHLLRKLLPSPSDGVSALAMFSDSNSRYSGSDGRATKKDSAASFQVKNTFEDIDGSSKKLLDVLETAKTYAESDCNVFINGETGTGKELFAQSIHGASFRKQNNFVAINCAAIPEHLLESELFGYKEGAFTGSVRGGKRGLFELADKGTLFLDEIGNIPVSMQVKLLRVLQENEIMPVGGDSIIPVDVRIIAATNLSIPEMLANGFRTDLLYRLNVLYLNIPPLRERGSDVITIFKQFLYKHNDIDKIPAKISDETLSVLQYYSWPGNIRELENVCHRFSLFMGKQTKLSNDAAIRKLLCDSVGSESLFNDITSRFMFNEPSFNAASLKSMVETIKFCFGYSYDHISELLGISRTTLWRQVNSDSPPRSQK